MASTLYNYPGINIPLWRLRQNDDATAAGVEFYRYGSFEGADGSLSELIQVREVAMLLLMDRLTDRPDWNKKVFDDSIVAKWRHETLTQNETDLYKEIVADPIQVPMPNRTRIINEAAFDYCIAELKCKAVHFEETGLIFTLNSSQGTAEVPCFNTAIKADSLVTKELQTGLKVAFEKLRTEQAAGPNLHPGNQGMVQDLVDPSMYPFVYGESKFIPEEVVGVADAVDRWSGKGEAVQPLLEGDDEEETVIYPYFWSETYQWLPANLAFQEDGSVRFTSYINNLHPQKHANTYRLLERLIETVIPAWESVLSGKATTDSNDAPDRLKYPPAVNRSNENDVWGEVDPAFIAEYEAKHGGISVDAIRRYGDEDDDNLDNLERDSPVLKWGSLRDPVLMEPLDFEPYTYTVEQRFRERFKETGLQVIVKMASIELTPEKPKFPKGHWQIEGQLNEHIVATALYYLDSENVTASGISFRMATDPDQAKLRSQVASGMHELYERFYGTTLGAEADNESVQPYGSVATPEGRLLAFPNVFTMINNGRLCSSQRRVSSFSLQDGTKPGHRRFVALWLVDPFQRIISTANVPPQRLDWWVKAVFGSEPEIGGMPPELFQILLEQGAAEVIKPPEELLQSLRYRLPAELREMVRQAAVPAGLMTAEQARQHRKALMNERINFSEAVEERAWANTYAF
ncbi:hypothetical protein F5144DRAFT_652147 [Chaetomium tenue]|uniref:Uncharacterized protein n=1 Tax=Chaetomium tenue TaxID=1854479 RepID=A0ACB7P0N2_9PEZI|nr:hypothetical protein F5144DRAFT_652147 [Chaetomium globosum]